MLEAYLVTLTGLALAQITPGPNLLAVAGAALGQGRRSAFFVTTGVACGILVWASLTAFGLAALLRLYPALFTALKLVGGAYLGWLGLRSLAAAWRGREGAIKPREGSGSAFDSWKRGLLVNLTNPKAALLWTAISTFLYASGLSAVEVIGFAPIGSASALVIYGAYALLFSSGVAQRAYLRFARIVDALFALSFGALGGKLIADVAADAMR